MPPPPQVTQWLTKNYPKPRVDPEWLDGCYNWLTTDQNLNPTTSLQTLLQQLESQLLQSDLSASMLHGTGLPINVSQLNNTHLEGPPVLVEIVALTEVAHSALSLQTTRQVRIERMAAGEEEGEPGDEDGEGEGPVPKYPRGMLRFELSDGATILQAIEYRSLPELALGVTPLGYKMLLKNVLIRRGIAFLEPRCVVMKGHQTEDREALQDSDFARGLRLRLGQPEPEPEAQLDDAPAPAPAPVPPPPNPPAPRALPPNPRSPLRELSEPLSPRSNQLHTHTHDDDEDQPRRRRIPNPNPTTSTQSSTSTLVQSQYFNGSQSRTAVSGPPSTSTSTSTRVGTRANSVLVLSPARSGPVIIDSDDDEAEWLATFAGPKPPARVKTQPPTHTQSKSDKGKGKERAISNLERQWGEDGIEEMERTGNDIPSPLSKRAGGVKIKGEKGAETSELRRDASSPDFGDESLFVDDAFLEDLRKIEVESFRVGSGSVPVRDIGQGGSLEASGSQVTDARWDPMEVITIEDDDEDDKENVPVSTRHVRRRIGGTERGRPVVMADPEDVIDISDSD